MSGKFLKLVICVRLWVILQYNSTTYKAKSTTYKMSETPDINTKTILFFDGNCGLCNRSVKFVLRKEKDHELFFSPLQSEFAKKTLQQFNLSQRHPSGENKADTMLLLENGKINFQSSAALRTTKYLKGLWPCMMIFIIVPPFIRNAIYNYIAKNRITWFGIADYCDMMTPELKKRFIE